MHIDTRGINLAKNGLKLWILVFLLSILVTLFTSCKQKVVEEPVTLDNLLLRLNEIKNNAVNNPLLFTSENYLSSNEVNFDYSEKVAVATPGEVDFVTNEEILEDIDVLFKLLKADYGCYEYFGGDDIFLKVKDAISAEISNRDRMKPAEFAEIILHKLSFLQDSHFSINDHFLELDELYYYMDEDKREFHKDSIGYYTRIDDMKWYLEQDMVQYMKLTIANSGELVYGLFEQSNMSESKLLPKNYELWRGKKKKYCKITWIVADINQSSNRILDKDELYQNVFYNNMPVISIKTFMLNDTSKDDLKRFIQDAERLKDEKAFILDLRNNLGGQFLYSGFWIYNLTGKVVLPKVDIIKRVSDLQKYKPKKGINTASEETLSDFSVEFEDEYQASYMRLYENENITNVNTKYGNIMQYRPDWLNRDQIIFVIMNKETYSSAEYFLLQLSTIENVVFLGTNSNGCLTGNMIRGYYCLPHSKIRIKYGDTLYITDVLQGFDTRGLLPDICIGGEDPIDAISRCYNYYK